MPLPLRGHHLLCLLTYQGEGYNQEFILNFNKIAQDLNVKPEVEIVSGPDAICAGLVGDEGCGQGHCTGASVTRRDDMALKQISACLGQRLDVGARLSLTPTVIERLRQAFAAGEIREVCAGCEWSDLCSAVAAKGFAGVHLGC